MNLGHCVWSFIFVVSICFYSCDAFLTWEALPSSTTENPIENEEIPVEKEEMPILPVHKSYLDMDPDNMIMEYRVQITEWGSLIDLKCYSRYPGWRFHKQSMYEKRYMSWIEGQQFELFQKGNYNYYYYPPSVLCILFFLPSALFH